MDRTFKQLRMFAAALLVGAGVLLWVAAFGLYDRYGVMSLGVGVVYVLGVVVVIRALRCVRALGMFLGGGFCLGCGLGSFASLLELMFCGTVYHLIAAAAFVLGALGTALSCIPAAAQLRPAVDVSTRGG
ncbi:MAG: hypothetical protein AB7I19_19305 [Planctomycetota bacterium]